MDEVRDNDTVEKLEQTAASLEQAAEELRETAQDLAAGDVEQASTTSAIGTTGIDDPE